MLRARLANDNHRTPPRAAAATADCSLAHALVTELARLGIREVYGLHGGPLLPVLEALEEVGLDMVLVKHETAAVFAADGQARVTGRPALVVLTSGPGTTNGVTGAAAALRDQVPLFILGAGTPAARAGMGAAQELDTVAVMAPVTKAARLATSADSAVPLARHLVRIMNQPPRGPVFFCLPSDIAAQPVRRPPAPPLDGVAARPNPAIVVPPPDAIVAAARLLANAARPAVLVGYGGVISGAGPAVVSLAEALQCGVASTPRAKGVISERHPLALGPFGLAGSARADREIGDQADVLLGVASRFGEVSTGGWMNRLARPRLIRVDIDPTVMGLNYPSAVDVVGDARLAVEGILGEVRRLREATGAPAAAASASPLGAGAWFDAPAASSPHLPLAPEAAMAIVGEAIAANPADEVFVDIGTVMLYAMRGLVVERPRVHINWTFGSMGHATPAAVGAARATGRRCWAVVGDAAFAQTGIEIHTACERHLPVVLVVFNNGGNVMCEAGVRMMGAQAPGAMFEQKIGVAAASRAFGARAREVQSAQDLRRALAWATSVAGPTVIEVHVDPRAVPPMGARVSALSFARAAVRPPARAKVRR